MGNAGSGSDLYIRKKKWIPRRVQSSGGGDPKKEEGLASTEKVLGLPLELRTFSPKPSQKKRNKEDSGKRREVQR